MDVVCYDCGQRDLDLQKEKRRRAYRDWLGRAPVLDPAHISGHVETFSLDEAAELCMRAEKADTWFNLGAPSWVTLAGGHHHVLRKRQYSMSEWEGQIDAGSVFRTPDGHVVFVWEFLEWFDDGR